MTCRWLETSPTSLHSYDLPATFWTTLSRAGGKVFLEGTQGSGLSLYHRSYPYVTSRDTTASGCLAEAGDSTANGAESNHGLPNVSNSRPEPGSRYIGAYVT
jgi:hypothetical protein